MACHERGGEPPESNGGQGRNRTSDTRIFSAVLYQLSYLAPVCVEKEAVQKLEYTNSTR